MADDRQQAPPPDELKEPHLLDLANLQEVAMWLLAAAASGAVRIRLPIRAPARGTC